MSDFFPNQRYTSEGEPELGIGEVQNVTNGRVSIYFPNADESRIYATNNAPLRRAIFKEGDTIFDKNQHALLVERVELQQNLYRYFGKNDSFSEADLGENSVTYSFYDKLSFGQIDPLSAFNLRRKTLNSNYKRRISAVKGFLGGRIDLIPHQLYIAHEVSSRFSPRVLLSDQVGLGKTVEACLILHRLLLSGQISRVLIIVPESLVHQWFVEILRRFNLWFHIFDEERCSALDESAPDGNPFLDDQLVICSIEFLAASQKRTQQAVEAAWDMLVVDEAHHLAWSPSNVSTEYDTVEKLSKVSKGLLLLTATPEQLGLESHFARLRLLDADRYNDFEQFKNEVINQKNAATIVEKLASNKKLTIKEKSFLSKIFDASRVNKLLEGDSYFKDSLIEDLLDQHGTGRVVFRNTRSAMKGFPKRIAHLHPIILIEDEEELWLERYTNEFRNELNKTIENAEKQEFWFDTDPRVLWLKAHLKKYSKNKMVLICKTKEKVLALEAAISKKLKIKVAVFHEALSIVQRDKNAAWFSEPNGASVLLCSEIGSEGRNFQFAHNLILFDLPQHPELLEQRIGRLDRIGQTEDIHIHIPYVKNSSQEVFVKWYHVGLNAFEENNEGGDKIFNEFGKELIETTQLVDLKKRETRTFALLTKTKLFHDTLKKTLSEGRDKLLEMNSFRPEVADKLIRQIKASDRDKDLEDYLSQVFEHFSIEMEDLAPRTYFLYPNNATAMAFPSVPEEGISATFDRNKALNREDISFLTWDHPMTSGAIDLVLMSGIGSVSYAEMIGKQSPGLLLEVLFVLETAGRKNTPLDRYLPNTPIRVVVDHFGNNVTELFTEASFSNKLISGLFEGIIQNEQLMQTIIPNMMDAATSHANELKTVVIENGLRQMNQQLGHEINRLKQLQKKNKNIRNEEILLAEQEKSVFSKLINDARLRMDAILLIRKG